MVGQRPSVTVVMTADDQNLSGHLDKAESKMTGLVNPATVAFAAITAAVVATAAAISKVVAVLNEWEELAMRQIKAERMLTAVVKSTGEAAGFSAEYLIQYAAALQKVTSFADEDIIPAMAKLASFVDITGARFLRASETMLDMAVLFGSLDSAAVQLGKALNDPVKGINAMARSGVSFTEAEKDMIKALVEANDLIGAQNVILDALANQGMGGLARATADASEQLKNAAGDMKELGGELWKTFKEPWIEEAIYQVNAAMDDFGGSTEEASIRVEALSRTLLTMTKDAAPVWGGYLKGIAGTIDAMIPDGTFLDDYIKGTEELYEQEERGVRLERELAEVKKNRERAEMEAAKATKEAAKAEAEHNAAMEKATKNMLDRSGGVQMLEIELPDAMSRSEEYVKAEEKLQKARGDLAKYLDKDSGFTAAIEGLTGLNSRITAAAASRKAEDKQLEVLQKSVADAERHFQVEHELWVKMEGNLAMMADPNFFASSFQ